MLEGVAFAFRDNLEALREAGTTLSRRHRDRRRLALAPVAQDPRRRRSPPVDLPADGDYGAAFGAARLRQAAATGADPLVDCTPPLIVETIEPDGRLADAFEEGYGRFRALYPAIRGTVQA